MMVSLSIALKDMQIFLKDRGAVVTLFLVPLLFIVVFSGALGAIGETETDNRLTLPVVDLDGGEAAATFLKELDNAGGVQVERYDNTEAMDQLDAFDIARVLIIPSGFSSGIAEGQTVTLRLVNHSDADAKETEITRLVVEGVALDMGLESQIIASLQQMGKMQANASEEFQVFTAERVVQQAHDQFVHSQEQPLIEVRQTVPGEEGTREEMPDLDEVTVPGFAVLFVFLTAQATARSFYEEKKVGSFRRLLAAPMSKTSLLVGKLLPNFLTALIQFVVMFAFGIYGLRLLGLNPVSMGNDPLAFLLVVVLIALCSSAFGIVIAAIARTENQIGGLSIVLLWGMGIVGGSIIPLFALEKFIGTFPMIVPHYWANRALDNLIIRGVGLAGVTTEMTVLLGFTILFFAIGLWRFDFD